MFGLHFNLRNQLLAVFGAQALASLVITILALSGQRQPTVLILVFLVLLALAFGIALGVGRRLEQAAGLLGRSAEALANGDLTNTCTLASRDELGAVAAHLNRAIAKIQEEVRAISQISDRSASTATELSATMTQMDGATQEISVGADRQRMEVQGSTQSIDNIATFLGKVQVGISADVVLLDKMIQVGQDSVGNVADSIRAMEAIKESSSKVEAITTVISEIANQTNLLSLNAAIEAAKAQEYGKGFAVVANEVRILAERSAIAARDISELIQESGSRVQRGADSVQVVQGGLEELVSSTRKIFEGAKASLGGVQSQMNESSEVTERMGKTLAITDSNASATHQLSASVSESVRTIEELARMTHELQQLAGRFHIQA